MTAKGKLCISLLALLGLNGASLAVLEGNNLGNYLSESDWAGGATDKIISYFSRSLQSEENASIGTAQEGQSTTASLPGSSQNPKGRTLTLSASPVRSIDLKALSAETPQLSSTALTLANSEDLSLQLKTLSIGGESQNSEGTSQSSALLTVKSAIQSLGQETDRAKQIQKISGDTHTKETQLKRKLQGISIADYKSAVDKVNKHFKNRNGSTTSLQGSRRKRSLETQESQKFELPTGFPAEALTKKERIAIRTVYATLMPLAQLRDKSSDQLQKMGSDSSVQKSGDVPDHKQLTRNLYSIGWTLDRLVAVRSNDESTNWGWGSDWNKNIWSQLCNQACGGEEGWKQMMRRRQQRKKEVFERSDAEIHRKWMTGWCWTSNCFKRTPEQIDALLEEANAELELAVANQILTWVKQLNVDPKDMPI
ncbi:hypothetical protein MHLP_04090 [Candidatus Mycoplasma haematolamae str. Purdue]|uniref:Uncharacterized protein n=1 Tax=Mycoplasma haematolamae (strain Purdue) TaxID=1212765 RepID=I7BKI1_MYCHA|nr:hypothetical protein [Candidatus Mycoplasma haematolamae]AFO52398.1 hypothetical protein MHLP_04090 [Candidatus Mycoplasma haematolamae str. Purdue]